MSYRICQRVPRTFSGLDRWGPVRTRPLGTRVEWVRYALRNTPKSRRDEVAYLKWVNNLTLFDPYLRGGRISVWSQRKAQHLRGWTQADVLMPRRHRA